MKAFYALSVALGLFAVGCGSAEAELFCEGQDPRCDAKGYVPLCAPPQPDEDTAAAGGLFCSYNGPDEPGVTVTGDLDVSVSCSGGEPETCADGSAPECYFVQGCADVLFYN